ncbi:hypothetical protein ACFSCX_06375 [Bacillus salitolerans]|uniref:Uncharacterized protein n=1 Tax=Bacillus salitolerans TaxID=1437434 RepID=A0ABW4LMD2_9BACI
MREFFKVEVQEWHSQENAYYDYSGHRLVVVELPKKEDESSYEEKRREEEKPRYDKLADSLADMLKKEHNYRYKNRRQDGSIFVYHSYSIGD